MDAWLSIVALKLEMHSQRDLRGRFSNSVEDAGVRWTGLLLIQQSAPAHHFDGGVGGGGGVCCSFCDVGVAAEPKGRRCTDFPRTEEHTWTWGV